MSNRDDTNGDLSERLLTCHVLRTRQVVSEAEDEAEVRIKVEHVEKDDTNADDEEIEEVKCEDGHWINQVMTIQPSLLYKLSSENNLSKKSQSGAEAKKGSIVRMNIQTLVPEDQAINQGITLNKQDTYLSMSDIESFRQYRGLEHTHDALRVGTTAVSGENILEEIA